LRKKIRGGREREREREREGGRGTGGCSGLQRESGAVREIEEKDRDWYLGSCR
jgi:hypothetical protein